MILINPGSPNRNRGRPAHTILPIGANAKGLRTDDILISLDELIDFIHEQKDPYKVLDYIIGNLGPTLRPTRKD